MDAILPGNAQAAHGCFGSGSRFSALVYAIWL